MDLNKTPTWVVRIVLTLITLTLIWLDIWWLIEAIRWIGFGFPNEAGYIVAFKFLNLISALVSLFFFASALFYIFNEDAE